MSDTTKLTEISLALEKLSSDQVGVMQALEIGSSEAIATLAVAKKAAAANQVVLDNAFLLFEELKRTMHLSFDENNKQRIEIDNAARKLFDNVKLFAQIGLWNSDVALLLTELRSELEKLGTDPIPDPDPDPIPENMAWVKTKKMTEDRRAIFCSAWANNTWSYTRSVKKQDVKGVFDIDVVSRSRSHTTRPLSTRPVGNITIKFADQVYVVTPDEFFDMNGGDADDFAIQVTFDSTKVADGYHWIEIDTDAPEQETGLNWFVFVRNTNEKLEFETVPAVSTGYENWGFQFSPHFDFWWGEKKVDQPNALIPLPDREYVKGGSANPVLYYESILGSSMWDITWTKEGDPTTCNIRKYFEWAFSKHYPTHATIEGPRGQARSSFFTYLFGGRDGHIYFLNPHTFGRIDKKGKLIVGAGVYHTEQNAPYYDDAPHMPYLARGIWKDVEGSHIMSEPWAFSIRPGTDAVDDVIIDGEPSHSQNVILDVADTGNNRILAIGFDGRQHLGQQDPVITVLVDNVVFPWANAHVPHYETGEDEIWISEKLADRVIAVNVKTKARRTILEAGIQVSDPKLTGRSYPLSDEYLVPGKNKIDTEKLRQFQIVGPDSIVPFRDRVYVSSATQRWVISVKTDGTDYRVEGLLPENYSTHGKNGLAFMQIAIDPGHVFEAGTILSASWSAVNGGLTKCRPGDKEFSGIFGTTPSGIRNGVTKLIEGVVYATAVTCGPDTDDPNDAWIAFAGTDGIFKISNAKPDDFKPDHQLVRQGLIEYYNGGLTLLNGPGRRGPDNELPENLSNAVLSYIDASS